MGTRTKRMFVPTSMNNDSLTALLINRGQPAKSRTQKNLFLKRLKFRIDENFSSTGVAANALVERNVFALLAGEPPAGRSPTVVATRRVEKSSGVNRRTAERRLNVDQAGGERNASIVRSDRSSHSRRPGDAEPRLSSRPNAEIFVEVRRRT